MSERAATTVDVPGAKRVAVGRTSPRWMARYHVRGWELAIGGVALGAAAAAF